MQIAKQNYLNKITQKLGDPNTSSKRYWSLSETPLNGKKLPVFLRFFMVTKALLIFKKNVRILIVFFSTNVFLFTYWMIMMVGIIFHSFFKRWHSPKNQ